MLPGRKLLLALWAYALALGAVGCAEPPPPRHGVLIVIDTLRADMLEAANTPNLDALAARGQRPELVWSSSTWTAPSVISLFTGQHVRGHGWDHPYGGARGLPPLPKTPTLAEVLAVNGFATTGFYANGVLSWRLGFRRGFDTWERHGDGGVPARVTREVEGWGDGRRHFLYVHLMGPHGALAPSVAARRRWGLDGAMAAKMLSLRWARQRRSPAGTALATDTYRNAYKAVIEDTDIRVGRILRALEPVLDQTVLIVTSDHGEMLGERGRFGHRAWVDEALTRVPLIAFNTGDVPERMTSAAVADLLTRSLGIVHPWPVGVADAGPLVSQRQGKLALSPDGRVKGVWQRKGRLSLVDLAGYPEEGPGLKEREAELIAARGRFEAEVAPGKTGGKPVLPDAETLEALRELGYLDDSEED